MNDPKSIDVLIGGLFFLGVSLYILVISGYRKTARQSADYSTRFAEWYRRSAWSMWFFGLVLALFAGRLVSQGISKIQQHHEHAIADVIAGLIGVVGATYVIVRRKKTASWAADGQEQYAAFLRRNSWILLLVGILCGLIGIALICVALARPP